MELLRRVDQGQSKDKYPPQLRSFALTLNFYSAKAYDYVRKTFCSSLPHPSTLRKWYQGVDGSPGFTSEAFSSLSMRAEEAKKSNKKLIGGLILDEMSIRSHIEWDNGKFSGYVDLGTNIDDDEMPHAKEALIFMVNSLNCNWKIPIAYFLINGLNSQERANLLKEALCKLHDTGIKIVSVTFDGLSANLATVQNLGASISPENLKNTFPHPVTQENVCVLLDVSHMIKLVRNTLATKGSIFDQNGGMIRWDFFRDLADFQDECGVHAANKLRRRHIEWYREKMKVKLATQVFSQSVAQSLEYLSNDLKVENFQGVTPTIEFIKIFNNLFDILNSKNLLSKGYKSPIKSSNYESFFKYLLEAESYIRGLRVSADGEPILHSNRKMGFLGFLTCVKSVMELYSNLCGGYSPVMKFLLTYKLSQDHLEMFFSAIRSKGGHNNNPTAKQFKAAYVRLLCHHEIMTSDSANCISLDDTHILNVSSAKNRYTSQINYIPGEDDDELVNDNILESEMYVYSEKFDKKINEFVTDVVGHISGCVVRILGRKVKCQECMQALHHQSSVFLSRLSQRKDNGGLLKPVADVVKICKTGERNFRVAQAAGKLIKKNIMHQLLLQTMKDINSEIFSSLKDHIVDHPPLENHRLMLIKAILFEFFKIRFYHVGKQITEKFQSKKVRSINNKTTLFMGQ